MTEPSATCPVCGAPAMARPPRRLARAGRLACSDRACGHAWGPAGAATPAARPRPHEPGALERRLGIASRRQALDSYLLEDGLGRRALVAGSDDLAGRLAQRGWATTSVACRPATIAAAPGDQDAIVLVGLAHVDPVACLSAARTRLAPRGRLVARVDNRLGLVNRRVRPPVAAQAFTPASLRRAAHAAGLSRALVFTSSCGAGLDEARARARAWARPGLALARTLIAGCTVLDPGLGEEAVLWAMV